MNRPDLTNIADRAARDLFHAQHTAALVTYALELEQKITKLEFEMSMHGVADQVVANRLREIKEVIDAAKTVREHHRNYSNSSLRIDALDTACSELSDALDKAGL